MPSVVPNDMPQISFAGVPTFMRAPAADFVDLQGHEIAVVGAPHDATTLWKRGARDGPRAIREQSLHLLYLLQSSYDEDFVDLESGGVFRSPATGTILDLGDLNVYPENIQKTAESFRQGVREIAERRAFPLILGGDHYVSLPCCQGYADAVRAHKGGNVGYVQIGCELGLGTENPTWGSDYSGSQVRRLLDLGIVEPRNVALIGPSGLVPLDDYEWAKRSGLTLFTAEDVRREGVGELTQRAVATAADGCESVYVSIGLDALDSSQSPGVGSTVIGGLHPTDLGRAAEELAQSPCIGALDVVEVAPDLDRTGRTARLAAYFLGTFLSTASRLQEPRHARLGAFESQDSKGSGANR